MGAPYGKICSKVEDAFEGVITNLVGTELSDVQVVKGFQGTATLTVPRIHIVASSATAEMFGDLFTGNWVVEVTVALVSQYKDTTRAARENMSAALFDMLLRQDIEELLNNRSGVQDFHAYGGAQGAGMGYSPQQIQREPLDHGYMETLTGTLYCRPSTGE